MVTVLEPNEVLPYYIQTYILFSPEVGRDTFLRNIGKF
jgi:hypothetical protein